VEKHCRGCDRTLTLMDFYVATTGNISSRCKECTKAAVKANRLVRADYYRQYEKGRADKPERVAARKAYTKTPEGREASNRAKRAFLSRNPEKRAAHMAVSNAIRDGKLTKQPCEVCGNERAQAHHDDYSKPLEVRWLCVKHHAEHHKNLNRQAA